MSQAGRERRIAVLGAGIMGASLALLLARRGNRVVLVDAAAAPFSGASRWNEGKIHLGYLYAGDPALATARRLLPGGLAFRALVESLLGCALAPAISRDDDVYLVHRDSVVAVPAMRAYFDALTALAQGHPSASGYLCDIGSVQELGDDALDAIANRSLVRAGFRVPERSLSTLWLADRYVAALAAEPGIDLAMRTRVVDVVATDAGDARWRVVADASVEGQFDAVVNATWEGRLALDARVGLAPVPGWSHRYRQSLFVHTRHELQAPSAVIATGPFGDVKNYNGRDFYLSWYPDGLRAEGNAIAAPAVPVLDADGRAAAIAAIADDLAAVVPFVRDIIGAADDARLEGGWVFAMGQGSLADPHSGLHRRDRFGVRRRGSFYSVDTGKYSTAPLLAVELARRIDAGT